MGRPDLKAVPDAIDAAIAAASEPEPVAMTQLQVTIASTGRPAVLAFPADVTEAEMVELCGWMLNGLIPSIRQQREAARPASRLILPS